MACPFSSQATGSADEDTSKSSSVHTGSIPGSGEETGCALLPPKFFDAGIQLSMICDSPFHRWDRQLLKTIQGNVVVVDTNGEVDLSGSNSELSLSTRREDTEFRNSGSGIRLPVGAGGWHVKSVKLSQVAAGPVHFSHLLVRSLAPTLEQGAVASLQLH
jgi:hypothetical protein